VGRRLRPYGLYWIEDPTIPEDYPGLARIAAALDTPVVAGEYCVGLWPFRHLLEARAVDIVMVDLLRVGWITTWLKVAAMAEAFNVPVVSHLLPEIHVQLVAAAPNGLTVEYRPLTSGIFEATPQLDTESGLLMVPDRVSAWSWHPRPYGNTRLHDPDWASARRAGKPGGRCWQARQRRVWRRNARASCLASSAFTVEIDLRGARAARDCRDRRRESGRRCARPASWSRVDVHAWTVRHDRSISNAKVVDAVHLAGLVDDCHAVA
jgi:hypothetical protein